MKVTLEYHKEGDKLNMKVEDFDFTPDCAMQYHKQLCTIADKFMKFTQTSREYIANN